MSGIVYTTQIEFNQKAISAQINVYMKGKEVVEDFNSLRVFYNQREFTDSLSLIDFNKIKRAVSYQIDDNLPKLLEVLNEKP